MFKIYSIMAAAALIAGALVIAPSLGPVSASTRGAVTQTTAGKGDRCRGALKMARCEGRQHAGCPRGATLIK